MTQYRGDRTASGRRVGVVVSRWNELATEELLRGCLDELEASGAPEAVVVRVAGSWEIPLAAKALVESEGVQGIVALGCILQGATNHAAMLAGDVAGALMSLQMASGVPVAWGILTPESQDQAFERAGMKVGHKGREAASTLIEQMSVLDKIRSKG